jgi:hypothetical protein
MDVKAWARNKGWNVAGMLNLAAANTEAGAINDAAVVTDDDGERYFTTYIYTVSSGSWGNATKFTSACKEFYLDPAELDSCEDWPEVESRADEVAAWMTEQAREAGMDGEFYYDHNEADGDFDFFYRIPLGKEADTDVRSL